MIKQILFVLQILAFASTNDRYIEHPDQQMHPHIRDKDYSNLTFSRDWNREHAFFEVRELNVTEHDKIWDGVSRDFRGDNFYTVSIKGGEDVTFAEYAYEAIKMTKAIINYHCSGAKTEKPVEVDFMVYDHNHRVYYESKKSADILEVDFKEATDVRVRIVNPNVRYLLYSYLYPTRKEELTVS